MKRRIFLQIAFNLMNIHSGIIYFEILNTLFPVIPSYLDKDKLGMNKSLFMTYVIKYFFVFLFDTAIICVVLKYYLNTNNEESPDETRNRFYHYTPIILVFTHSIRSFILKATLINCLYYAIIYTSIFYIVIRYTNYWIFIIIIAILEVPNILLEVPFKVVQHQVSTDIIPKPIMDWINDNNYTIDVYKQPSKSLICSIIRIGSKLKLLIMGDWESKFTEKEFISVLFHELGHVYYNYTFKVGCLNYILILMKHLGYFFIFRKYTAKEKGDSIPTMISLYLYLEIITAPIQKISLNGYRQYHEYLADSFSVEKWDKSGLEKFLHYLLGLNFYNGNHTILFGLLNFVHPPAIDRIEAIRN